MFDIYIRVSQLGERTEEEATEDYEAKCLEYAGRTGLDANEVVLDMDVSGETAVVKRKLERLIAKVESGESEGIITPYLDRFGRDLIDGALAYRRIKLAGGRLICVLDGVDSSRPGDEMVFHLRMAIAEDHNRRVRANFQAATDRALERGMYLASKPPYGYQWEILEGDTKPDRKAGRLVPNPATAPIIHELFRMRAAGSSWADMIRRCAAAGLDDGLLPTTRRGVKYVTENRAYVGEVCRSGRVIAKSAHKSLVTEAEWEAANAVPEGAYFARGARHSDKVVLAGLVRCSTCGRRLQIASAGRVYSCTTSGVCAERVAITAARLEGYVRSLVYDALLGEVVPGKVVNGEREPDGWRPTNPYVSAVLTGDTRWAEAQQAVAQARENLEQYRDDIETQQLLGMASFRLGLEARRENLNQARAQLRDTPSPGDGQPVIPADFFAEESGNLDRQRRLFKRLIRTITVFPAGGAGASLRPVEERVEVRWVGQPE